MCLYQIVIDTGYAPIHEAAVSGHPDVIRLLHKEAHDFDVNLRTEKGPSLTALHLAAQNNKPHVIIALIECGAILNSIDRCWRSPLDIAIEYSSQESVYVITMFSKL